MYHGRTEGLSLNSNSHLHALFRPVIVLSSKVGRSAGKENRSQEYNQAHELILAMA